MLKKSWERKRKARPKPPRVVWALGLSLLLLFGQTYPLIANPSGGVVAAGTASITAGGSTLTVNQATAAAIINWQQFSINGGELTKFIVPSSSAATLNRVLGGNPSAIYGTLQSNGSVLLINPNGIVVGPSGRIDTAGFIGSTLDVSDAEFLKGGDLHFVGGKSGTIDNEGIIHAASGDVYLIANQVTNGGKLTAPHGTVGLAAGTDVLFQQSGDQHLFVQANNSTTPRAVGVTNSGTIQAATAELRAAGGNAYALAINNTGQITATGFKKTGGQVYLTSDGADITNSGQITARNPGGNGGLIVLNGFGKNSSGTVLNSGKLIASGKRKGAKGGTVELLGNQAGITGSGVVDVSGDAGGGTALIGGDEHGSNPAIPDADQTYLGPDATITAEAFTLGDGGKIILWGNETTQAYGTISAQGGAEGGNGGFVETSAHALDVETSPHLSAPQGDAGTWLLDPYDLTISGSATSGITPSAPFTASASSANLYVGDLESDLQGTGATVLINTQSANNGGTGNITWENTTLTTDGINNGTLTLTGPGEITFNGATISGTGKLNLTLNSTVSAGPSDTFGNVLIENSTLSLGGGNLSVVGIGVAVDTMNPSYVDGVNIYGSQINAQGGNIFVSGQDFSTAPVVDGGYFGVFVSSSTVETSGTGTLNVVGTVGTSGAPLAVHASLGGVALDYFGTSGSLLQTANGALTMNGKTFGAITAGTMNFGNEATGIIVQNGAQVQTTGLGAISLTGDASGATTTDQSFGVYVDLGGSVSTLGSSTGITLTGTGSNLLGAPVNGSDSDTTGIEIQMGGSVTALGSTPITLMGTGGTSQNTDPSIDAESEGVGIDTAETGEMNLVSSVAGTITITGIGGASPYSSRGVDLGNGDNPQAVGLSEVHSDSGAITITGSIVNAATVTGSYRQLSGVEIQNLAKVDTNTGAVSITGTVDEPLVNGTAVNVTGVNIKNALIEANDPNGSVSIVGDVSGTTDSGAGIVATDIAVGVVIGISNSGTVDTSQISVAGGPTGLVITGYGGTLMDPGTNATYSPVADGIIVGERATLTTTGSSPLTLTGQGGQDELTNTTLVAQADGILVETDLSGTTTTLSSGSGTLSLLGTAGTSLNAAAGVQVAGESGGSNLITSGSGDITITGTLTSAATTTAGLLEGVDIAGLNTVSTGNGLIDIGGTVSAGNVTANGFINGVNIIGSATIEATGATGTIIIAGDTRGSTADGTNSNGIGGNIGVNIQGNDFETSTLGSASISVGSNTTSTSTTGISITGHAGTLDTSANTVNSPTADGIDITQGAAISATGTAPISLNGTGGTNLNADGATLGESNGIDFSTDANGSISITSASGTITLTGTGGPTLNSGVGVLIGATNTTAVSANQVTASIESGTGDIDVTGVGGTGYVGSGTIVGQYVPNSGVMAGDFATVTAGGSINLTGTGSSYSPGVGILQLPPGSFGTIHPAPVLIATGNFTATALQNTGIYLNGTVNGANVTLGSETSLNPLTITSGGLQIVNSLIVMTGGDFHAYGKGEDLTPFPNGVYIEDSTINGQGGSINVSGQAGYFIYQNASIATGLNGLNIAGAGTYLDTSTLETAGAGNISVLGDGTLTGTTVNDGLTGVQISSSEVTAVDGVISLTGKVNGGTAIANPLSTSMFFDSVRGVNIGQNGSGPGSTISATGTGSITIVGDTSGSISEILSSSETGDTIGVYLKDAGTTISVAGGTGGIFIQGTGGEVLNDQSTSNDNGGYGSNGIQVYNGASITAAGAAPITLTGMAGAVTPVAGQIVGNAGGVVIEGNEEDPNPQVQISSGSGAIQITGTAGTSANAGAGVIVLGQNGGTASITSGSGPITLTGTGGAGSTGAAATAGVSADNDGVAVLDGATIQSTSGNLIFNGTAGTGDPNALGVAMESFVSGDITTSTIPTVDAGSGSLTITAVTGGVFYGAAAATGSTTQAVDATFTSPDSVEITSPISKIGGLFLVQAPDISLDADVSATVGDVVFVDTGLFVNNAGPTALSSSNGHSWQVWSVNPPGLGGAVDQDGGLTPNFIQYDASYGVTTPAAGGNGLFYSYIPSTLAVTLNGTFTKTYDGTEDLTIDAYSYSYSATGLVSGDSLVNSSAALNATLNSKDVDTASTATVTPSQLSYSAAQGNTPVFGYSVGSVSAPASVTAATATAGLAGTVTKTYDANTSATLSSNNYTLGGIVIGDTVALNDPAVGSYDTANVGTGKTVTVAGLSISGADADDYVLASTTVTGAVGEITTAGVTASLTPSLTGTITKVYDGTTDADNLTTANYMLSGVLNGDAVILTGPSTGTYASQDVGSGILVTTSTGLQLSGAQAANYTLNSTTASGNIGIITPATVTASLTGAVGKTYDGTAVATLSGATYTLGGVLGADSVSVTGPATGTYASRDVATGINVTSDTGLVLSGAQATDYMLGSPTASGLIGSITAATLTVSLTGTVSKVYDMTTAATLVNANYNLGGIFGSDAVSVVGPTTGTYASKDVATGISVTSSTGLSLSGAQAGDYMLGSTTATGNIGAITPATVTASLVGSTTKTYDSTTTATLNGSNYNLGGVLGNDVVSVSGPATGTYAAKDVASGISVTSATGLSLSGAQAGDYVLGDTTATGNIGAITPATLTPTLTGSVTKNYDGTPVATLSTSNFSLGGLFGNDAPGVNSTAAYSTQNVGTNELVTVSAISLTGPTAVDYQISGGNLSANIGTIAAAPLAISANSPTIAPGDALPAFTASYAGLAPGETPSVLSGTLVFSTTATSSSPEGAYGITPSGLFDSNYQIQFVQGILTIATPTPVVLVPVKIPTPTRLPVQLPPILTPTLPTVTTPPTVTGLQDLRSGGIQPPPFTFIGSGQISQGPTETGGMADSTGNGGQVGSGDAVQFNGGEMNNVANPHAAGALDAALSFAVHNTLDDAMKALGDWADADSVTTGETYGASPTDGDTTMVDGGGVVEIDSTGVKHIPLKDAPKQLQKAMSDTMGGLQHGAGH